MLHVAYPQPARMNFHTVQFVPTRDQPTWEIETQSPRMKFTPVDISTRPAETTITDALQDLQLGHVLYIYACDALGRVRGDRLATNALARDHDKLLVVGAYKDHHLQLKK